MNTREFYVNLFNKFVDDWNDREVNIKRKLTDKLCADYLVLFSKTWNQIIIYYDNYTFKVRFGSNNYKSNYSFQRNYIKNNDIIYILKDNKDCKKYDDINNKNNWIKVL